MRKKTIICIVLCLFAEIFAKAIPNCPVNSYVYDENRILTTSETRQFNELANDLHKKTGVSIAGAFFKSIDGEDPRSFAFSIAEKWKIGDKGKDGILIFVTLDERRRSVETGYAVEEFLPDALVERFQQRTLVKQFRQGNYAKGILQLEVLLANEVAKHYNVDLESPNENKEDFSTGRFIKFFFFIILILFLLATPFGRLILFTTLGVSGRHSNSSWRGGGFGGGSFGGGGSGGSW